MTKAGLLPLAAWCVVVPAVAQTDPKAATSACVKAATDRKIAEDLERARRDISSVLLPSVDEVLRVRRHQEKGAETANFRATHFSVCLKDEAPKQYEGYIERRR